MAHSLTPSSSEKITKGQEKVLLIARSVAKAYGLDFSRASTTQHHSRPNSETAEPEDSPKTNAACETLYEKLAAEAVVREDTVTAALIGDGAFGEKVFPKDYLKWLYCSSRSEGKENVTTVPTLERVVFGLINPSGQCQYNVRPAYDAGRKLHTTMKAVLTIAAGYRVGGCDLESATYYRRSGVLQLAGCNHRMLAHVLTGERHWDLKLEHRTERIEPPRRLGHHLALAGRVLSGKSGLVTDGSIEDLTRQAKAARRFAEARPSDKEIETIKEFLRIRGVARLDGGPGWPSIYPDQDLHTRLEVILSMLDELRRIRHRSRTRQALLDFARTTRYLGHRTAFEHWLLERSPRNS